MSASDPKRTPLADNLFMTEIQNIPWKRLSVEAAAIVASILLAFAIDAWWGDSQRDEAERVVLQTLLEDLRVKKALLGDMNRFSHAIIESAETLLHVAVGTEQAPSEDAIDRMIGDTWWHSVDALWDSAPLNLLVAGSNLSLISNPELVQELAALQVAIGRVKSHYRNDGEFHKNVMTPFMIANANMAQITASMRYRPGETETAYNIPDLGVTNIRHHSELLSTIEFQNVLVAKIERLTDILDIGHPGVEKHLIVVIQMLEDALDQ
jgi:hypothetical protein